MNTTNKHDVSEKLAWSDMTHAKTFDYMYKMPSFIIKINYENFNDGRFLRMFKDDINGKKFFEVGCATGELYRYITNHMKQFEYWGFDISKPAIERAKEKYPQGNFTLLSSGLNEVIEKYGRPDVVWCRDVVLHQELPYEFLSNIIDLGKEVVVVRLRTRDVGDTENSSNVSCQLHWDKYWVPYIVLNIEELIKTISKRDDVKRIIIGRSYEILGGNNCRYLPKELYFSDAGGAETALFIQKGKRTNGEVEVITLDKQDRQKFNIFYRVAQKIAQMF